jgi:GT2 family glycosyltransferase
VKKISVQLVVWNGEKYIPHLFASLRSQTYKEWTLAVLDNASADETVQCIKNETEVFPVDVEIVENDKNEGFAGGHNRLFRENGSEYVLLLNQDMMLDPNCIERLVSFLDAHPSVDAVAPRLMKWCFESEPASRSDIVDSLGLAVFRTRQTVEWHAGAEWKKIKGMFPSTYVEVFGVSGALPMYRCSTLRRVAFLDGNIFDPSYDSYKEDVDLAFRLYSAGYGAAVVLDSVAYHDRSAAGPWAKGHVAVIKNKRLQSDRVRYQSYRNHLMTLYKNEYWQTALLDFPWIFWYELKKFLYYLFFDPVILKGFLDIWRMRGSLRRRKDQISAKKKVHWRDMRKYIKI